VARRRVNDRPSLRLHNIPVSWAYARSDSIVAQGLDRRLLFERSLINEKIGYLSFAQLGLLHLSTMLETGDAFIGLARGTMCAGRMVLDARVAMGCSTLGVAIAEIARLHSYNNPLRIGLRVNGPKAGLTIHCDPDFARSNDASLEEIYLGALYGTLSYFLGRPIPTIEVLTRTPDHISIGKRHYAMMGPVRRGRATTLVFPSALLGERRQGEPADDIWWRISQQWLGSIQGAQLEARTYGRSIRSLNESVIASRMDISPATLRRRFSAAGVRFRDLRNDAVLEASMALLEDGAFSVRDVAAQLGYSDARGFRRFIKAETGMTPDQVRSHAIQAGMTASEPEVMRRTRDVATRISV
jgi:AraC-like DNA-binding protein